MLLHGVVLGQAQGQFYLYMAIRKNYQNDAILRLLSLQDRGEDKLYSINNIMDTFSQRVVISIYNHKVVPVLPLTEHYAMKAYWGSGGTAPPIL
jgi:hypothetical protein